MHYLGLYLFLAKLYLYFIVIKNDRKCLKLPKTMHILVNLVEIYKTVCHIVFDRVMPIN